MDTLTMTKGLIQPFTKFFDAFALICETNSIPLDKECFVATAGVMYDENKITPECFPLDDFFKVYKKQILEKYINEK